MYIEKIEIQYFRSIYRETISDLHFLNVFTGKNDVGKSNVLKALNLFFNNETDAGVPFSFSRDFNFQRLEECQKTIKAKQFICIKVTFLRGNRSDKTLPSKFTVTKKWFRTDIAPSVSDDLQKALLGEGKKYTARSKSSLTAFLNKIRYIYVSAIKDENTFQEILALLRETIYNDRLSKDEKLIDSMTILSKQIAVAAQELNSEFEIATGIKLNLSSPKSISELYQTIGVDTQVDNNGHTINLNGCGDGIRIRYLPSILYYIAKNSPNMYIWGFEEPENSLEYRLALNMAEDFEKNYCEYSQILITSHSPAFIGLFDGKKSALYRCFRKESDTDMKTHIVSLSQAQERDDLSEELGYIQLQKELFAAYKQKLSLMEEITERSKQLQQELRQLKKPVLYTEGKTDVAILTMAWSKLYPDKECPFDIKSCNTLREEDGSAAGCDVLKDLLSTIQPDSPQLVLGLFDHDEAGIKAFSLNGNFESILDGVLKRHKNKKSYALLLPTPPGKEKFAEYKNLCIEFYFEKDDLETEVDGRKLELKPYNFVPKFNGVSIDNPLQCNALHLCQIDRNTKNHFAEIVVPTLPAESFVHFKALFEKITQILVVE